MPFCNLHGVAHRQPAGRALPRPGRRRGGAADGLGDGAGDRGIEIGIIDYGAGNLHSVHNALRELGVEHRVFDSPEGLASCDKLILPGVGAFGDSMACMEQRGLVEPVRQWLHDDRPFLGICRKAERHRPMRLPHLLRWL